MKSIFESCSEKEDEEQGPPKKPPSLEIEVITPSIIIEEKKETEKGGFKEILKESLPTKILTYKYECISNRNNYDKFVSKQPLKTQKNLISKVIYKAMHFGDIQINMDGNYINFIYKKIPEDIKKLNERSKEVIEFENNRSKTFGWKLHVSIDDENTEILSKAWDIVVEILIEHGIYQAKIVRPEGKFSCTEKRSIERGNQITIYSYTSPHVKWEAVIQEITENLTKAEIKPGPKSNVNQQITGSNYVTYRNDANITNDAYDEGDPTGFNPHNHSGDPFKEIVIDIKDQPQIPTWKFDEEIKQEVKLK